MSSAIKLKSTAGGSVSLQVDDTLTTDEIVVVQDPIGVNQTWQDMLASRAVGATYTNTTGRPIQISMTLISEVSDDGFIPILTVGGVDVARVGAVPILASYWSVMVIVPAGATYVINDSKANSVIHIWAELRGV